MLNIKAEQMENQSKEKELYELVDSLEIGNLDGIGLHESSFVDCNYYRKWLHELKECSLKQSGQ